MKFLIACMFIAATTAAVIPVEQSRQRRDVSEIVNEYIPPAEEVVAESAQDSAVMGEDGYRYKSVRRLKLRQRRDVAAVSIEYLAPVEEGSAQEAVPSEDSAVHSADGYKYKAVRRLKLRQRRDVSELPSEYLPPAEDVSTEAPVEEAEAAQDSAVLSTDGYKYKTVRRLKLRHRRDVSELPSEYLPPAEDVSTEAPVEEAEVAQKSAVLGTDGYQYKTVRRLKLRHRRDVSELPSEYLPSAEDVSTEAPVEEAEAAQDSAVLSTDGYKYKTVRRLKFRHRRDVSELPSEYLSPAEDVSAEAPVKDAEASQDSAVLSTDGYQYKTVRRLKLRHRRDVSDLPSEYLPAVEDVSTEAPVEAAEAAQDSAVLSTDGYQYKTARRLKLRHRRDVSELPSEYLPPAEDVSTEAPVEEAEAAQDSAVLSTDGYQYKTVRRLKLRHRRDVSELPSEYLPPAEDVSTEAPVEEAEAAQDSAVLSTDGYQYKTVRRLKLRHRRDVSELPSEYLPPAEDVSTEAPVEEAEVAQKSAVLGTDGYQYKTVRRLKLRHRRDVSELPSEYLPPAEDVSTEAPIEEAEAAQDSAVLSTDGYQYKTVRRLKLRHRRDVSELPSEYLPPAEDVATEAPVEEAEAAEDSAVLGAQGYQYKTVRRLKLRHRREVSELPSEYLPPAEDVSTEAPVEEAEAAQDSAILGTQGYQYKTVRRLKLRHRRDVSELPSEYLPPAEEVSTEAAPIEESEVAQESAVLGSDGYQYKTVRRLKLRHRRDVSELPSEYLPPSEEVPTEAAVEEAEAAEDSAVLGADGYQYKAVRRLKLRHRRAL